MHGYLVEMVIAWAISSEYRYHGSCYGNTDNMVYVVERATSWDMLKKDKQHGLWHGKADSSLPLQGGYLTVTVK